MQVQMQMQMPMQMQMQGSPGPSALGLTPPAGAQSMTEQLSMQLQLVSQQQQTLMTQMNNMSLVPGFQGSVTQQQMFSQFSLLQQQQQMLFAQQQQAQQQLTLQQAQQQQMSRAAGALRGGGAAALSRSATSKRPAGAATSAGPYSSNGKMNDAFSNMVASQAQAIKPKASQKNLTGGGGGAAEKPAVDESLPMADLDAAKMLGGMAINGIREATKRRSQRNLTDAAERAPAPAAEPRRGFFGGKKKK